MRTKGKKTRSDRRSGTRKRVVRIRYEVSNCLGLDYSNSTYSNRAVQNRGERGEAELDPAPRG